MKIANMVARILGILATVLLIVSVVVCFWIQGGENSTQSVPRAAAAQSELMMESLSQGNLEQVEAMLYGDSTLGLTVPEGQVEAMVWDAYVHGFTYKWESICFPVGESVCQNVSITGLNIPRTMQSISQRLNELMNPLEGVSEESGSAVPAQDETLEAKIDRLLLQATREVLAQEPALQTNVITLTFVQNDGVWQAVPDASLRNAISGGLGG